MSLILLYFLYSTFVLSFYIDAVLPFSILTGRNRQRCPGHKSSRTLARYISNLRFKLYTQFYPLYLLHWLYVQCDKRLGFFWHVCRKYETHWAAIYRESSRCVLGIWKCRIRWFYDVSASSHGVCYGWVVNRTATDRDPKSTCRDQLNVVLYVKKSRVSRICWGSGEHHIMCLSGMCVGYMRTVIY